MNRKDITLRLEIQKADGMDGGFGAYVASPFDAKHRVVLLNVMAIIGASIEAECDPRELLVPTLMHEFGHALEHWLGLEFDEGFIQRVTESYVSVYGGEDETDALAAVEQQS